MGKSLEIRADLTFKKAKRAMLRARRKNVPVSPPTIEETIEKLKSNHYSPFYQEIFLDAVTHKEQGMLWFYYYIARAGGD